MTSEQTVYNWETAGESGQWLLVVREEGRDTEHDLVTSRNYVIGRSQDADIRISNSQSSRKHAALIFKDSDWYVKDLKSKNGVTVGAKKVGVAKLVDGASFVIVDSLLTLKYKTDSQAASKKSTSFNSAGNRKKIIIGVIAAAALLIVIGLLAVLMTSADNSPGPELTGNGAGTENNTQDMTRIPPISVAPGGNNVALVPASAADNKEKARDLYRQGLLFYDNGNLSVAIELWDKALLYDRENSLLLQKLARATKELEYQVSRHFNLAQNHLKYQRLFEAERELTIVLGLIRDKSDARYQKASTQLTQLQK